MKHIRITFLEGEGVTLRNVVQPIFKKNWQGFECAMRLSHQSLDEIVLIEIIAFKMYVVSCYFASDKYINIKMLVLRSELRSYA